MKQFKKVKRGGSPVVLPSEPRRDPLGAIFCDALTLSVLENNRT